MVGHACLSGHRKASTTTGPPPTPSQLRDFSKGPRSKAPGPDGVPPYALYHLPLFLFLGVHAFVLQMHEHQQIPPEVSASETVCFYKKGDWRDGEKWRPIALSNSLYHAVARWIYSILVVFTTPLICSWQYGGFIRASDRRGGPQVYRDN